MAKNPGILQNMGVDYVITFQYDPADMPQKAKAGEKLETLVQRLNNVGLATEVRQGEKHSLLVFVKLASDEHMNAEIYRSRIRDWIHGVRSQEPPRDTAKSLEQEPLTEAERLRIIHHLITNSHNEGVGAGITPGKGEWECVETIFALHDHTYNKEWIKKWSTQWILTTEDLDDIRERLGEKIAFYFAFTQSYFIFLTVPAAVGFISWAFLRTFSPIYAVVASLWSVVFVEWWNHQEHDLAARWNVRGVSSIELKRSEFNPKHEIEDPITGEKLHIFPAKDRLMRQALQIPFVIVAVLVLGSLITTCFAIEVFISEVYSGPGKSYLTFLPTVILSTGLPFLSGILTKVAHQLTEYENYETEAQFERSLTAKTFVLNFVTSYLPLCLTSFVYIPFGATIVPYLDVFAMFFRPLSEKESQIRAPATEQFEINPGRLRKQVFYFTVTAQIVNFAMEVVVPYLKRQGVMKVQEMKEKRSTSNIPAVDADDHDEEKDFLKRVRNEAQLETYDVYDDLREMVVQFGYLTLFSVVWPLVPVSFLINNWIELRADAVKICVEMRRPTPWRADTIGPWLNALAFVSWLGSITMAALVYMFSNDGIGPDGISTDIQGWALLLSIAFSEHLFLLARWLVSTAISKIDSPGKQKERRAMFLTRRKYFQDTMKATKMAPPPGEASDEITRDSLEEEARQSSLRSYTPEERFWNRQRGWRDSAKIGRGYIEKDKPDEVAEKEKKEL